MGTDIFAVKRAGATVVFCKRGACKTLIQFPFSDVNAAQKHWRISITSFRGDSGAIEKLRKLYAAVLEEHPTGHLHDWQLFEGLTKAVNDGRMEAYELSDRDKSFLDRYYNSVSEKASTFDVEPAQVLGLASESGFASAGTYLVTGDAFGMTGGSTGHMTMAGGVAQNVEQFFSSWGERIRGTKSNTPLFLNRLLGKDAAGNDAKGELKYNSASPGWRKEREDGINEMRRAIPIWLMLQGLDPG